MASTSAKDLLVYQKAFELAMEIYRASREFPAEERFSLTSQIRRSSRSVCLNIREAWAKRRYEAHFVSKLTDCDGECNETDTALEFAYACGYLSEEQHAALSRLNREVGRLLGSMLKHPGPFLCSKAG